MPDPFPPPARTRLSGAARRQEIVAAVVDLAATVSPALITTGGIAEALNLTQGAVFKHFPTKDAIWLAVMDWVEETLLPMLAAAGDATATPVDGLEAIFMAHVDFVIAHPGVPRLIFNELQQPDDTPLKARVRVLLENYRKLLARLLAAAQEYGEIGPDSDRGAAAMLFIGTIQGLVMQSMMAGSTAHMAGAAERVFVLYRRAIGAAAS